MRTMTTIIRTAASAITTQTHVGVPGGSGKLITVSGYSGAGTGSDIVWNVDTPDSLSTLEPFEALTCYM